MKMPQINQISRPTMLQGGIFERVRKDVMLFFGIAEHLVKFHKLIEGICRYHTLGFFA